MGWDKCDYKKLNVSEVTLSHPTKNPESEKCNGWVDIQELNLNHIPLKGIAQPIELISEITCKSFRRKC